MTIERIGHGAGKRDFAEQPNLLRLFVGQACRAVPQPTPIHVWVLETNLDDVPGEVIGYCFDLLFAAGALDVFTTPIEMKKNRPGVLLSVLRRRPRSTRWRRCCSARRTTFGVRRHPAQRHKLQREPATVETPWGPVKGKLGWRDGQPPVFTPEYEDCARVARQHGIALQEVYAAACKQGRSRNELPKARRRVFEPAGSPCYGSPRRLEDSPAGLRGVLLAAGSLPGGWRLY